MQDVSVGDLESQAAQLLLSLQVTTNPAFDDVEGFHDEELLMRADPLGASAKKRSASPSELARGSFRHSSPNSSPSSTMGGTSSPEQQHQHQHHSQEQVSIEVEAFRAALKQQRVPTLRLLVGVSRKCCPALLCTLLNATQGDQNSSSSSSSSSPSSSASNSASGAGSGGTGGLSARAQQLRAVQEFCPGGRFDSLYYDAKFKNARNSEKQKHKALSLKEKDKKSCTFKPMSRQQIAEQQLAWKRGQDYEELKRKQEQEEEEAKKKAASAAGNGGGGGEGEKKEGAAAEGEGEKKKEAAEEEEEEDPLASVTVLEPDAFFKHSMEWKKHKDNKMKKKMLKLEKDQQEEDEVVYKQWKISEESTLLAREYRRKQFEGEIRQKPKPLQYTFRPETTPYKSERAFFCDDVLERMQIDSTRRKEDQMHREIAEAMRYRASTPKLTRNKMDQVFTQLSSTKKKQQNQQQQQASSSGEKKREVGEHDEQEREQEHKTFRKQVPFEEPTFHPKIGRAPTPKKVLEKQSERLRKRVPGTNSAYVHAKIPVEVKPEDNLVPVARPMTGEEAAEKFHLNEDEQREREDRLEAIRSSIQKKRDDECSFQPNRRKISNHHDHDDIHDEKENTSSRHRNSTQHHNHKKQNTSSSSSPPASSSSSSSSSTSLLFNHGTASYNDKLAAHYFHQLEEDFTEKNSLESILKRREEMKQVIEHSPALSSSSTSSPFSSRRKKTAKSESPDTRVRRRDFSPPHLTPSRKLTLPSTSHVRKTATTPVAAAAASSSSSSSPPKRKVTSSTSTSTLLRAAVPDRPRRQEIEEAAASSYAQTYPDDEQIMLVHLSHVFSKATDSRHGGPLLPLSAAMELVHRICVEKKIVVTRLLNLSDLDVLFPSNVGFCDFVKMFEICVGMSLTQDAL